MRVIPFLLAFILLVPVIALAETYTYGPVTVTGPDKVAIGETFNYTVNVQQIFNHYKIVFVLSGYNLTGASPISPQYLNGTFSPQNFTITAPSVQTTLYLFFQVIAYLNNQIFYYNITETVQVLNYTILKVKVYNPTNFIFKDLNVSFYVNGKYVGSSEINISGNTTENVTYQWLSGTLSPGIYNIQAKVNSTVVKIMGGKYSIDIQVGNPFLEYIYIIIAIILAMILVIVVITAIYNRRNKPKWKK